MFTCQHCLDSLAVVAALDENGQRTYGSLSIRGDDGQPVYLCEPCLDKTIADELLDMTNRGEMRIAPGGKAFETTALYDARRKYEAGEVR